MLPKMKMLIATLSVQSLLLTFALVIVTEFFFFISAIESAQRDQLRETLSLFENNVAQLRPEYLENIIESNYPNANIGSDPSESFSSMRIDKIFEMTNIAKFYIKYQTSEERSVSIPFSSNQDFFVHGCDGADTRSYDDDAVGYFREALYTLLSENAERLIWVKINLADGRYSEIFTNPNIEEINICLPGVQDRNTLIKAVTRAFSRSLLVSLIVSLLVSLVVYRQITLPIRNLFNNLAKITRDPGQLDKLEGPSSRNYEIRKAEQAVHDLGKKLRSLKSFHLKAESISHDLANRLNTEALLGRELVGSNSFDLELIQKIQKARESTMDVLNGILNDARFSTEGPKYEAIDVASLIERIKDDVALRDDRGETEYIIDIKGEKPEIYGEQRYIFSALFNLFHNAVRAVKKSQIENSDSMPSQARLEKNKIEIRFFQTDRQSVFEIEDNGPGIDPELRKNLFELPIEYERGRVHHVGLRDAVSYILVHDGSIQYKTWHRKDGSGPTGTTFTIKIPRNPKGS